MTPVAPSTDGLPGTGSRGTGAANTGGIESVRVKPLQKPDPDMIGVLGPTGGALPIETWRGTPRGTVRNMIERLPAPILSPALRDLARRLLLSPVLLDSSADSGKESAPSNSVIVARLERLMTLGATESVRELGNLALNARSDPEVRRLVAEAELLAQDYASACQLVADGTTGGDLLTQPYWQRLLTFCQILEGDLESAALGTELLSDREDPASGLFRELAQRLIASVRAANPAAGANGSTSAGAGTGADSGADIGAENEGQETRPDATAGEGSGDGSAAAESEASAETPDAADVPATAPSNALDVAMLRLAGVPVADSAWTGIPLAVIRAVAFSPNAPLATRLAAMERAVAAGAADPADLGELYAAETFDETAFTDLKAATEAMPATRARALLYQAALSESAPAARLEIAGLALSSARSDGNYAVAAGLYVPLIRDVPASPEFARFAPVAARAFYAAGETEPARKWAAAARSAGAEGGAAADDLLLFAILTEGTGAKDAPARWRDARLAAAGTGNPAGNGRSNSDGVTLGLVLIEAMGTEVPTALWREQATMVAPLATDGAAVASPALRIAMRRNAAEGRIGETLTLLLAALAGAPRLSADALLLQDALAALRAAGFVKEAAALAVEAALDAGL